MANFKPMHTAPKDRPLLLLTADFGAVEGFWREDVPNFYRSQPQFKSYDPDNMMGDWCSNWRIADDEHGRLICGASPTGWAEIPTQRAEDYCGTCQHDGKGREGEWWWCDDCGAPERFRIHELAPQPSKTV